MAADSLAPPPSGGGNAKYLVVLLLLLAGGLGVFLATRKEEAATPAPPVKKAERSTALSDDMLAMPEEIPEPEPEQPAGPEPVKKPIRQAPAGDPWECAGDIPQNEIRKVLNEYQATIRSCYERRLRNDNALQGDLKLQVRVDNDGSVAMTRVRGSLNDKDVRECVQGLAKRWSFPAPTGGSCAVFDAPYNFMPKN